jgi:hypothetical protein
VQYSSRIRNAQLEAVAAALGPAATLKIFSGACPSSCDAANPPGEIAALELPRKPFRVPDGGKLMISESWAGLSHAPETCTAKSFRVMDYLGEVHIQGTITKNGLDGDLQLDTTEVKPGQRISIGAFTIDAADVREEQRQRQRELEEA